MYFSMFVRKAREYFQIVFDKTAEKGGVQSSKGANWNSGVNFNKCCTGIYVLCRMYPFPLTQTLLNDLYILVSQKAALTNPRFYVKVYSLL